MKILFLAATDFELDAARRAWAGSDAFFRIGGWGGEATFRALEQVFAEGLPFDRIVDVGIAGSETPGLPLGTVIQVVAERNGDREGPLLHNPDPWPGPEVLPQVIGRTLQELDARWRREPADVETMEGAAFFAACLQHGVPFSEIRSVSNHVGEEDRSRWDIPLALRQLETALIRLKNES